MSPCIVIVREVAGEDVAQVRLAQNEDVVQTFTPHRTDQPLHERILPRTVRRREDFLDGSSLGERSPAASRHHRARRPSPTSARRRIHLWALAWVVTRGYQGRGCTYTPPD